MREASVHDPPVSPVLDRARRLTPLIQAHRNEGEQAGRMAPAVHAALVDSRLYEAAAPVEVGGDEISLLDEVRIADELAYADPSVAWCVLNSWACGPAASRIKPAA